MAVMIENIISHPNRCCSGDPTAILATPVLCSNCHRPERINDYDEVARWLRCLGAPHNVSNTVYEVGLSLEGWNLAIGSEFLAP
jgi:hypothetical protein